MDFEHAKSFLSQHIEGQSVYEHLSSVIRKIINDKPQDAISLFENISLQVKQNENENLDSNKFDIAAANQQERQEMLDNLSALLQFYGKKMPKKKQKNEDDEEEEEEEETEDNDDEPIEESKLANVLQDIQLLQWAGIVFTNKSEPFQLQQSITKFVKTKSETIETSRFFGKIQGLFDDYWILECKLAEYPDPPEDKPEKQEPPGAGCNEFVYFVTTDLSSSNWQQLPDATPDQLKQSRNIYRMLSGNLENKVCGQTYFDGLEKHLLRCQIARIVSSCILAPASYYNPPEDEDEENPLAIELSEEFEGVEEASSLDSWVHQRGHLRLEGRYVKFKNGDENEDGDDDENENKEEKQPTPEELEEQMPILQPISNDKSKSLKVQFSIDNKPKTGNEDEEPEEEEDDDENGDESKNTTVWHIREINKNNPYSILNIQNKLWPGHHTLHVKNSKKFLNIYIGNGLKYQSNYYVPKAPSQIESSFAELIEPENEDENEETADADAENNDDDGNEQEKKQENAEKPKQKSIFDEIQSEVEPPPPEEKTGDEEAGDEQEDA